MSDPVPAWDSRGFFARTFCAREYAEHGLDTNFVQHSSSYSGAKGTLRGMHFQRPPTYRRWRGFELTPGNCRQLYIPAGFAHSRTVSKHSAKTQRSII